ncbi:hypothetical protein [Poriferisphaera corsica]|uniref:hypothetical protein n=1 Tax=Poriferisphaera corsica TaxID=2528020 RepID=UPI0011A1C461|nr:hypothetical protein [Poriferisphaera corsica]
MNRRSFRTGFVLILVLMLLALAGVSLAMMARRSHGMLLQVAAAEQRLQRQWLLKSSERYMLPQAAFVLDPSQFEKKINDAEETSLPKANHKIELELNDKRLLIILSNENARADVNELLRQYPTEKVEFYLRKTLSRKSNNKHGDVQLRPLTKSQTAHTNDYIRKNLVLTKTDVSNVAVSVASYEQIFQDFEPLSLMQSPLLTCWSGGPVDYRIAPKGVLMAMLAHEIGEDRVRKLVELRDEEPNLELTRMFGALDIGREQREYVESVLGVGSPNAFGMLVLLDDGKRTHVAWMVQQNIDKSSQQDTNEGKDKHVNTLRFIW